MALPSAHLAESTGFGALDWSVLSVYLGIIVASGVWFSRKKQQSTDDYFRGSGKLPAWAVAVSIVATSLSAATFLGVPESSYTGDLTYIITNLGMIIASVIIAFVFIPAFYRYKVSSIYEYLEHRFSPGASKAASGAFLLGRLLASGARLYLIAIPLTMILFGAERELSLSTIAVSIAVITAVGILYTLIGGITSVVWTDVVQYAVLVGAGATAVVLILSRLDAPAAEVMQALQTGNSGESKLRVVDLNTDLSKDFTVLTAIFGFTILGLGSYGTDQDLAQRMLTCKDAKAGARSVIGGILLGIPTVLLFLVVGLALWLFYNRPELFVDGASPVPEDDARKVFLVYIMSEMPSGVTGLMVAGLFAAGLSSVNSAMNAMSAAFVTDFYRSALPNKSPEHYVRVGRLGVIVFGVLLGLFALLCVVWQQADREHQQSSELLNFALGVMGFAYAGLVAVFLTALLTKRGSTRSVILSILTGFVLIYLLQPTTWANETRERFAFLDTLLDLHFTWKLCIASGICFAIASAPRGKRDAD